MGPTTNRHRTSGPMRTTPLPHRSRRRSTWIALLAAVTLLLGACGVSDVIGEPPTEPTQPGSPTWPPGAQPADPSPPTLALTSRDVGQVGVEGRVEAEITAEAVRVLASGSDIWGTADSFHFAFVVHAGDLDVSARIDALDDTHLWAKAGVMIRESLDAGARHALTSVTPGGAAEFIRRSATGGTSTATVLTGFELPTWVRLTRSGSTVRSYVSADGSEWVQVGQTELDFEGSVHVGIAVTSRDQQRLGEALVTGAMVSDGSGQPIGVEPTEPTPTDPAPTPPPPTITPPPGDAWVCGTTPLAPAYSPTLYVSTGGSDGSSGRSPSLALRTLQRAADLAGPGDVVWVAGGTYAGNVSFRRSGTSSAPIVFESAPGECAILDSAGLDRWSRPRFEGVQHVVFRNFIVRNSGSEGIQIDNSHDNVFSHLRTYGNFWSGIGVTNSNRNLFQFIITHDNVDPPHGSNADGISISSGDGNRISHCIAYGNSDDGVDTWVSTNSIVEYCVAFENGRLSGDGNGFKLGGDSRTVNTLIRHSVAFGNRTNGFDHNTGRGVRFDHNTAFDNGRTGFVARSATLRNNLSVSNQGSNWNGPNHDNVEVTNSWNLGITGHGFVSTSPTDDGFLRLGSGSPAIDRGTAIGLPYGGSAPDLGALELGQTIRAHLGVPLAYEYGRPYRP
jgi:parallel beta-helix repeat protein